MALRGVRTVFAAGLLGAAGVVALAPAPAHAVSGTVFYDAGGMLVHVVDAGGAQVTFLDVGSSVRVSSSKGMTLTSGAPCTQVNTFSVDCPRAAVDFWELTGTSGPDTVFANGTTVDGELFLGGGNDYYQVGRGKDFIHGEGGTDSISYDPRALPVSVSLNGQDDDGQAGEDDYVFSDVEIAYGGSGDDTFRGNGAHQEFRGGPGNDTFHGSSGASDLFEGYLGFDTIAYDDVPPSVSVGIDLAAQRADVGTGAQSDTLFTLEKAVGGPGDDIISGTFGPDWLVGGGGKDVLRGSNGNDVLFAEGNGSTMDGGQDGDTLYAYLGTGKQVIGGSDVDTVSYVGYVDWDGSATASTAPVTVDLDGVADDGYAGQKDKVFTDVENIVGTHGFGDKLTGNTAANELTGLGGNDTLSGAGGNDVLAPQKVSGSAGDKDVVSGGGGKDEATYADAATSVNVSLDGVANDGAAGDGDNVKSDVEVVEGSAAADVLRGSGAANTLLGGGGPDSLLGGGGVDVLDGGTGADDIQGGAGIDTVSYASRLVGVTVTLDGAAGDGAAGEGDWVHGDIESIEGSQFDDHLVGNDAVNKIAALHGEDQVEGRGGNDVLDGGEASDVFVAAGVKDGADKFIGGSGQDTIDYGARTVAVKVLLDASAGDGQAGENDTVKSDIENVVGGGGNDVITGSLFANVLSGGGGNDTISGGDNDDTLYGGSGDDTLDGGAHTDFADGGPGASDRCLNVESSVSCELFS